MYREVPSGLENYSIVVKLRINTIDINADTYQTGLAILTAPGRGNGWYVVGFLRDSPEGVSVTHTLCVEGCWRGSCIEDQMAQRPISIPYAWFRIDVMKHETTCDFKFYWKQDVKVSWSYRGVLTNKFIPKYVGIWCKTWRWWSLHPTAYMDTRADYIFIRKYVDPEPDVKVGNESRIVGGVIEVPTPTSSSYGHVLARELIVILGIIAVLTMCIYILKRRHFS